MPYLVYPQSKGHARHLLPARGGQWQSRDQHLGVIESSNRRGRLLSGGFEDGAGGECRQAG